MFKPDYLASVADAAVPVRLAALSFIIPVPKGVGEPMLYPYDVDGTPEKKAGMPILSGSGKPKGTGLVFTNYTDNAVQAVRDDGKEMIIVNDMTAAQATMLMRRFTTVIPAPEYVTAENIRKVLDYAHGYLGINDFFDGDRAKIPGFEPQMIAPNIRDAGLFLRRSDEERFAILGIGTGTFEGPASTPQRFHGNVVQVSNAKHAWLVQTSSFLNTYRHPDDRDIGLSELPAFKMQEGAAPVRALDLK